MKKCEICKEEIETERQLDDMIVCSYCYQDAIDSDSWAIRPENYRED